MRWSILARVLSTLTLKDFFPIAATSNNHFGSLHPPKQSINQSINKIKIEATATDGRL